MEFETLISSHLCTEAILCLVVFLLAYNWYKRPKNFPPGPRGLPFVGVLPFVGKYPERKFAKWSIKYGPIMSVRMGSEDWVVLNDFEKPYIFQPNIQTAWIKSIPIDVEQDIAIQTTLSICQAFVKQKEAFSGRPRIPVLEQIHQNHGIVFVDDGPMWASQRKFGLTTLRGFGVGKRSMEERVQEEAEYLCQAIHEQGGKPFDILVKLSNAVSNNICSVICGKRFGYDDKLYAEVMYRLNRGASDPASSFAINALIFEPKLIHFPPFSRHNKELMDDIYFIIRFLKEIISDHKSSFDGENLRDFVDAFIKGMEKGNDEAFTELQLLQYIRDLFAAGTETTSTTLRWSILAMIHYPNTQKKLYDEISNIVGNDALVKMQHKADMPYTSAFIEEIYRFRTIVPLNVPHKTTSDVTINGYFIPKNTQISSNLWAIHNDPKIFTDPEVFLPERHLDDKGKFVKSNRVIPFSVGPRHCLGEQLARMEVFIFLVSLIQKFEFKPNPNDHKLPDIDTGSNGFLFVPVKFKVVASER